MLSIVDRQSVNCGTNLRIIKASVRICDRMLAFIMLATMLSRLMAELSKARKFLEVLGYPYPCGRVGRVAEKRPLSGPERPTLPSESNFSSL